jgi:Domain of unknown function (DUF397)
MEYVKEPRWRKPSRSGANGGNCVEVGQPAEGIAVRDTKNRDGAELRFSASAWRRLVGDVKAADASLASVRTPRL